MAKEEDNAAWIVHVNEVKGILDVNQKYTWELIRREIRESVIFSKDAPEKYRGMSLSELDEEDRSEISKKWYSNLLELEFKIIDEGLNVSIKQTAWIDRLTINTSNPQFQSWIITMIQKLGNVIEADTDIDIREYLPLHLRFEANPKAQLDKKGKETGFHELDIETIKAVKAPKLAVQKAFTGVSDELRGKVFGVVDGCKSKEEALKTLIEAKKSNLIGAYLAMVESGEIVYTKGGE